MARASGRSLPRACGAADGRTTRHLPRARPRPRTRRPVAAAVRGRAPRPPSRRGSACGGAFTAGAFGVGGDDEAGAAAVAAAAAAGNGDSTGRWCRLVARAARVRGAGAAHRDTEAAALGGGGAALAPTSQRSQLLVTPTALDGTRRAPCAGRGMPPATTAMPELQSASTAAAAVAVTSHAGGCRMTRDAGAAGTTTARRTVDAPSSRRMARGSGQIRVAPPGSVRFRLRCGWCGGGGGGGGECPTPVPGALVQGPCSGCCVRQLRERLSRWRSSRPLTRRVRRRALRASSTSAYRDDDAGGRGGRRRRPAVGGGLRGGAARRDPSRTDPVHRLLHHYGVGRGADGAAAAAPPASARFGAPSATPPTATPPLRRTGCCAHCSCRRRRPASASVVAADVNVNECRLEHAVVVAEPRNISSRSRC